MNNELELGTQIETEHGGDEMLSRRIASQHLAEDPHYYSKLMAAGLGDNEKAQEIASNERAYAGQVGPGAEGVAIVKKGAAVVTPQPLNVPAPMSYAQRPALKSSNIGSGAPSLKSSGLSPSVPSSNSVVVGKTLPKAVEPSVEGDQNIVNKTTGAKMPHQVKVGNTQPIQGGDVGASVVKIAVVGEDPLDYFGSQINRVCEGGSSLKKATATRV